MMPRRESTRAGISGFLANLLIFSVLALLWARRAQEVSGLAALCEWRFGLLALGLPSFTSSIRWSSSALP
jgi:hypothetical protein